MENTQILWEDIIALLRSKLPEDIINEWILKLKPIDFDDDTYIFQAFNKYHKAYIEKNYIEILRDTINELVNEDTKVKIIYIPGSEAENKNHQEKNEEAIDKTAKLSSANQFYDKYTFDTFVVGSSNRIAYTACLTVAQNPYSSTSGLNYNPLFIYGESGLGKTHLLHAIGNHILKNYPQLNVLYTTAETFLNDFIWAIKNKEAIQFQKKYRLCDVLLMDDVHFLSGKESAQEEFFHTFNALHQNGKRIILTSDRPPSEIPKIEQRIVSRFNWGLITDIQRPDFETRLAILQNKVYLEKLDVPNDVLLYIAEKIQTNIRDLEGALLKIVAYSSFLNKKIDIFTVKDILKDIAAFQSNNHINIDKISDYVSDYFNISKKDLLSKSRKKYYTKPRHIAMYLARELTDMSLPEIGRFFKRDHTSVLHACEKVERELQNDQNLRNSISDLRYKICR